MDELAELRAENARLREENACIPELKEKIAALAETVAMLSKALYGDSSERSKHKSGKSTKSNDTSAQEGDDSRNGDDSGSGDSERRKRGHKKGDAGHGRRDYSDLETEEIIHDLDDADKFCKDCGTAFKPLDE